ncbi:MAG: YabP/YqfC family sporulation protein [Eubacteriales bacterium]|nr:YabP/YqfC family sporulation protein [Eubacteriales bacterium]
MFRKKKKSAAQASSFLENRKSFVCTMCGQRELDIENYGTLGNYDERCVVLHGHKATMIIEGEGLLVEYFTDVDMRVTGYIHSIRFC